MGFISTGSWRGEDDRFYIETARLPHKPFTEDQKNYINGLPLEFADADAVEITVAKPLAVRADRVPHCDQGYRRRAI
jgi:hypothetical protein